MNKLYLIVLMQILCITAFAQKVCTANHGEAYSNNVLSGKNHSEIDLNQNVTSLPSSQTNIFVYLFTSCKETPKETRFIIGKKKFAIKFSYIQSKKDNVGIGELGTAKVIKAGRGLFLWKAAIGLDSEAYLTLKGKVLITGFLGSKNFSLPISSIKKLQDTPMY